MARKNWDSKHKARVAERTRQHNDFMDKQFKRLFGHESTLSAAEKTQAANSMGFDFVEAAPLNLSREALRDGIVVDKVDHGGSDHTLI